MLMTKRFKALSRWLKSRIQHISWSCCAMFTSGLLTSVIACSGNQPFTEDSSDNLAPLDLDLAFGTPETLDVITWNIETFPKVPETTPSIVAEAIQSLQPDVLAIQEVWDQRYLEWVAKQVGFQIETATNGPDTGLMFMYNPETVIIKDRAVALFQGLDYDFGYRGPVVLELRYRNHDIRVINVHYKCCGNGLIEEEWWDEEYRRLQSSQRLKAFLDEKPDVPTMVVGDWNDELSDPPERNIFQPFLDNPSDYRFADESLSQLVNQDLWSFPSFPSHIDHILLNRPLFNESRVSGYAVETILLEEALRDHQLSYSDAVSDHRPVGIRLTF